MKVVANIRGIDEPREALFLHLLTELRRDKGRRHTPACLRDVSDDLFRRLSPRFANLHRAAECRWRNGGVVLRQGGGAAVLIGAKLACDGAHGCAAEGVQVTGNFGGDGQGYSMHPVPGGWEIRRVGVSWAS